jgi:hypothetical protein
VFALGKNALESFPFASGGKFLKYFSTRNYLLSTITAYNNDQTHAQVNAHCLRATRADGDAGLVL